MLPKRKCSSGKEARGLGGTTVIIIITIVTLSWRFSFQARMQSEKAAATFQEPKGFNVIRYGIAGGDTRGGTGTRGRVLIKHPAPLPLVRRLDNAGVLVQFYGAGWF